MGIAGSTLASSACVSQCQTPDFLPPRDFALRDDEIQNDERELLDGLDLVCINGFVDILKNDSTSHLALNIFRLIDIAGNREHLIHWKKNLTNCAYGFLSISSGKVTAIYLNEKLIFKFDENHITSKIKEILNNKKRLSDNFTFVKIQDKDYEKYIGAKLTEIIRQLNGPRLTQ